MSDIMAGQFNTVAAVEVARAAHPSLLPESPEATGIYACTRCTNTKEFVGVDDRGWGGTNECEGDCGWAGEDEDPEGHCKCETALTQSFTVTVQDGTPKGTDIDYHCFAGGSDGAEIGAYTRIYCGVCGALLWLDDTLNEALKAAIPRELGV